jgi:hypothetical protein
MLRKIHNVETGEIVEVELSTAEVKQLEKEQAEIEQKQFVKQAEAEAKATAKAALLTRLGITAEEAQLLLGGN